jgi:hypothetical protein
MTTTFCDADTTSESAPAGVGSETISVISGQAIRTRRSCETIRNNVRRNTAHTLRFGGFHGDGRVLR